MKKILIVDDEKETVDIIQNFLTKQGFVTLSAYDGEEAKKKIIEASPDVVLLDLIMPKTGGFDVLEWMRKNISKRIPVIILSIKDKVEDIKKGYHFDADFYLPKPFTNQELLKGITTVLSLSPYREK